MLAKVLSSALIGIDAILVDVEVDLAAANRDLLIDAGLPASRIQMSDMCVSCHYELFFSYRRDSGETGRQMGFIMLNAVHSS